MSNPLQLLQTQGQSVWLDYLCRSLITSGDLKRFIERDGVIGLTSNPSIFEKAITGSCDYRDFLEAPELQGFDAKTLYERIAVRDIQEAADLFQTVYVHSKRRDGYVSLEVSPKLAHDTLGTLEEARRLWQTVDRENLMIKVPGTPEGIPAVQQLISEGINVNVTLLFSQAAYEKVAQAYLEGLETLARRGSDLSKVASVASFFISRIDTAVDSWIDERIKASYNPVAQNSLRSLLGKVAIASAKNTYQKYLEIIRSQRWQDVSRRGAQPQRLLWASTGTKNPSYSDILYVSELIGPDTVNTMPTATLEAFRDHGSVRSTLTEHVEEAASLMDLVKEMGIPFDELTGKLLNEGVKQFADAFEKLLKVTTRVDKPFAPDPTIVLEVEMLRSLDNEYRHP